MPAQATRTDCAGFYTTLMEDLKLQFKRDTGLNAVKIFETQYLTQSLSGINFEGSTKEEIIEALNYDEKMNAKWGIFLDEIPDYNHNNDIALISHKYVEWLENKLHENSTTRIHF